MADGFYYQKIWTTRQLIGTGYFRQNCYEVYTNAKAHERLISLLLIGQNALVCKYFDGKYSVTVQG